MKVEELQEGMIATMYVNSLKLRRGSIQMLILENPILINNEVWRIKHIEIGKSQIEPFCVIDVSKKAQDLFESLCQIGSDEYKDLISKILRDCRLSVHELTKIINKIELY